MRESSATALTHYHAHADHYAMTRAQFIYYQPGNGKVKIKEPKQQVQLAQQKLEGLITQSQR